ncbi:dihydrolipoamide acetyltransferase family protein [Pseudomonas matsuisoli]|uniref:Dihydrolipoamide acetyltransferase component of pyruvate dehydrogenase complex n=1 Tax=Pseudomonas matsuisoli TaxID=1515666 RepID=A0A917Q2B3_9PSED|nr:dihydrolipoamide acetyltransferase family protein [Pseudomonas matsuisoli]GGK08988.1 lipoamide acyltransferase component of branched-chain alpha-keto acid dehydrogenase complex [Pseudomonas matsuisoli]
MGTHVIKMPDIGEGIAEVELVKWYVAVGDTVTEDQHLADVMTDKAMVEIPCPVDGVVATLGGEPGEVMAVGAELIRLEVEGAGNLKASSTTPTGDQRAAARPSAPAADAEAREPSSAAGGQPDDGGDRHPDTSPSGAPSQTAHPSSAPGTHTSPTAKPNEVATHQSDRARAQEGSTHAQQARLPSEPPLASPAVRQHAWDLGIELRYVHGTGPNGRILHEDLDAYLQHRYAPVEDASQGSPYQRRDDEQQVPIIGLRRKIAEKMQEAKRRIPHFTYVEELDVTDLEALRIHLNHTWEGQRPKLTVLPFLMRALVVALRDFPQLNARYDDENGVVTRYGAVHLGIATQSEAGLSVPVVRHAEARDLWTSATEVSRLAAAVRANKATREELSGSTITISSLGALGGIASTPVINHPEVAIVGVNRIVERPVIRGGQVAARKMMNLSSSFDHRVVDGMDAAAFIQAVRALLEHPATLFLE